MKSAYRFFLGGHDLEMVAIRDLLVGAGHGDRVEDKRLAWGVKASAYRDEIGASLARGETPVLIELPDDLDRRIDRAALLLVDHHGARAGADAPSALRQIFDLLGGGTWTRRLALVEANDVGHAEGMRELGASPDEIRKIRDADRNAQGVSAEVETESRRALAAARRRGGLTIVETTAPTASAICDFLLPEYGGAGAGNLLVVMPGKVAFFGEGRVVRALAAVPDSWHGGALPKTGYWGSPREALGSVDELIARISGVLGAA